MSFTPDSPLVDRVQPSPSGEIWSRNGVPIRAIVIHMAQGGGTAGHLDNLDGNSSHYVVDYNGNLVQMVPEAKAAGSMNPSLTRKTDDAPFDFLGERIVYGVTALKMALGLWYTNPNAAVIAIETEGFADKAPLPGERGYDARANPLGGPNDEQRVMLAKIVADIRRRRGALPCIGHRDQQSYKACPGKRIPWVDYGGHGVKVATVSENDDVIPATITNETPAIVTANEGHTWRDLDGRTVLAKERPALAERLSPYGVKLDGIELRAIYATVSGVRRIVLIVPATNKPVPPPPAPEPEPQSYEVTMPAASIVVGGKTIAIPSRTLGAVDLP